MIDLSQSVAKKTVEFDPPITGRELIEAVKATCVNVADTSNVYRPGADSTGGFYQDKRYDDGLLFVVGRSSSYPYENLLVTPDKTSAYIEPEKTYTSAVVVRHDQPAQGSQTLARYDVDDEIKSVLEFSEGLAQTVRHGQSLGAERSRDPLAPAGSQRSVQAEGTAKAWGSRGGGSRSAGPGPRGY